MSVNKIYSGPSFRPHKMLGAEGGAELGGGEHPFYDAVAITVTEPDGGPLHRMLNSKVEAATITDLRVVERDGVKTTEVVPVLDRYGRPQRVMEYAHTLDEHKAFVADGEYIIPVHNERSGNWAVVHVCWEQYPAKALGWNRFPVWQMRPLEYALLGHESSVEYDDACESAAVWARQLQDTRLLEDLDGWGNTTGWQEVAMNDATLEAIDYHQRFGHRITKGSVEE